MGAGGVTQPSAGRVTVTRMIPSRSMIIATVIGQQAPRNTTQRGSDRVRYCSRIPSGRLWSLCFPSVSCKTIARRLWPLRSPLGLCGGHTCRPVGRLVDCSPGVREVYVGSAGVPGGFSFPRPPAREYHCTHLYRSTSRSVHLYPICPSSSLAPPVAIYLVHIHVIVLRLI